MDYCDGDWVLATNAHSLFSFGLRGGVGGRRTEELACSPITSQFSQAWPWAEGFIIFGETMSYFCITMKQASLLWTPA